jgi:hypothetical protein
MRHRVILPLTFGCALAGTAACAMPSELPGERVGSYAIEGALTENSCGSQALPAADPLKFNVELRQDDQGQGVWMRGMPPGHPGKLEADGHFRFVSESIFDVRTMPPEKVESLIYEDIERLSDPNTYDNLDQPPGKPCRLAISERIEGRALRVNRSDAGGPAYTSDAGVERDSPDLIAENEVEIRPASGDCAVVLSQQGGPFLTLPCRVHYDLEGTLAEQ